MILVNNRKVFIYSSVFIALILNVPKLFALKKDGIVAQYWHFNLAELILQTIINLIFCLCLFYYSVDNFQHLFEKISGLKKWKYIFFNLVILAVFSVAGVSLQRTLFKSELLPGGGVMLRLIFSLILVFIELRIIYLLEETKSKELENEHLRNEILKAGMTLLKAQLNPHFFFNALSSLSAVVRENPAQAQVYISHLSKIFRYSLRHSENNLVLLKEELNVTASYAELMKMRYEKGLEIKINIDEKNYNNQIPHMSLQPLIENAVKHNSISTAQPLIINICIDGDYLSVANNLNPVRYPESGEGIGLANLNERYRISLQKEIEIIKTADNFTVKLPF